MDINKIINNIVWYIPFKKLRNAIRDYLHLLISNNYNSNNPDLKNLNHFISEILPHIHYLQHPLYGNAEEYIENNLKIEKYSNPKRLDRFGYKVYSQNEEDGIINEIFNRIGRTNKFFVEFGVENGLECNTHFLLFQNWKGVFIEANPNSYNEILDKFKVPIHNKILTVINSFITAENINNLLSQTEAVNIKDIDLLSIDIDGNDYHVFNSINVINPRVVVIEYNSKFPPPIEYIMPYDKEYCWNGSDKHGVSLYSITKLANIKGYNLVGTNLTGTNAFFVRKDLCGDKFIEINNVDYLYNPWRAKIRFYAGHPSYSFLPNFDPSKNKE